MSGGVTGDEQRQAVAALVAQATDGAVQGPAALTGATLFDLGLSSLGWLRLVDALEAEFDVELDLDTLDLRQVTVDDLVGCLGPAT